MHSKAQAGADRVEALVCCEQHLIRCAFERNRDIAGMPVAVLSLPIWWPRKHSDHCLPHLLVARARRAVSQCLCCCRCTSAVVFEKLVFATDSVCLLAAIHEQPPSP